MTTLEHRYLLRPGESGYFHLVTSSLELPPISADEVLVQTEFSALDTSLWLRYGETKDTYSPVETISYVGKVLQVGKEVEEARAGQLIAGMGTLASHMTLPLSECISVPSDLDARQMACFALSLESLLGVRRAEIELGESVLVLGLGLRGQLILQFARLAGAGAVWGADGEERLREQAMMSGADGCCAVGSRENGKAGVIPQGVDLLIDSSGRPKWLEWAIQRVRTKGRVVLLAHQYEPADFDLYPDIHARSLTVIGLRPPFSPGHGRAMGSPRDTVFIHYLFRSGRLRVEHLLEQHVRLKQEEGVVAGQPLDMRSAGVLLEWQA